MVITALSAVAIGLSAGAAGLTAEVQPLNGSPTLFVNGKPTVPLMFYGWAAGSRPTMVDLAPEWRRFHLSFVAPEDNEGHCGVHIRMATGPGAVWVDDARFYQGPFRPDAENEQLRCGDWECSRDEAGQAWTLFVKTEAGAKAQWAFDATARRTGDQSGKVVIEQPGQTAWHVHLYQTGLTVRKGQRYTFSLWLKGDRERQAEIQVLHHGPPWRIYSGTEDPPMDRQVRLAAAAGVHLHSFGLGMPWPQPGQEPDFSKVDETLEQVIEADPEALLLPRFGVDPPGWWYDEHPDEALEFDDGQRRPVCVASTLWREQMVGHVRRLVAHCEAKYGDRMLGYHPCAQHTGEWFYPRTWEARHSGFSPAMQRGFAAWLEDKYGDVQAFRQAWAQPDAEFETASVPTVEERGVAALGLFRDPQHERRIIDFHEYQQVAMVEPLELVARAVKEETGGRKLVVLFYGYYFESAACHSVPKPAATSPWHGSSSAPNVDVVCSPISYGDRGLGGIGAFMVPVDSVRNHGKLWLNEDDTRTYLTPENVGYGRVDTPQHTHWVHQRNFGHLLPRRLACWYMDLGGTGWLAGQDIWDQIASLRQIYEAHLTQPACWSPEVAVIVDEAAPLYLACNATVMRPLASGLRTQLYRMGTPFGLYLLSDLVAGRVPPAAAYLFVGCFHLTPEARRAVAEQTRAKTAVWFYGSGYLDDRASVDQMTDLVGMTLVELDDPPNPVVTVEPTETPLTAGLAGTSFGADAPLAPLWAIEPAPDTHVIGRFPDGHVAAAAVDSDAGRSIYIGALTAPAALLRNILQSSGVHVYLDSDDVLLTDGQFLAVTASHEGHKTIRLPTPRRVLALPDNQVVAEKADHIEIDLAHGETRLYRLAPPQ